MTTQRVARLSELIKEELGDLIREELKDPRIGFVTVTGVDVSPDIRHADVRLSILGDQGEQEKSLAGIVSARGHLRTLLGRNIRAKYTPELRFHLDHSAEYSARVSRILNKLTGPQENESPGEEDSLSGEDRGGHGS